MRVSSIRLLNESHSWAVLYSIKLFERENLYVRVNHSTLLQLLQICTCEAREKRIVIVTITNSSDSSNSSSSNNKGNINKMTKWMAMALNADADCIWYLCVPIKRRQMTDCAIGAIALPAHTNAPIFRCGLYIECSMMHQKLLSISVHLANARCSFPIIDNGHHFQCSICCSPCASNPV